MERQSRHRVQFYSDRISDFEGDFYRLPGIAPPHARQAFIYQIIDSVRRIEFIKHISGMDVSASHLDPDTNVFDPLKAAVFHRNIGNYDEACWLVFLAVAFSYHAEDRWTLVRDIYYQRSGRELNTWATVSKRFDVFGRWYRGFYDAIVLGGERKRFGSHRAYATLKPDSQTGPIQVVRSYVNLVGANRGHGLFFEQVAPLSQHTPQERFERLFRELDNVVSFGRLAKFDYLTMLSKLNLLYAAPGSPYLSGSTGPLLGAKLLFHGHKNASVKTTVLDTQATQLGNYLETGMQVVEDALCNWQKSPNDYQLFRG